MNQNMVKKKAWLKEKNNMLHNTHEKEKIMRIHTLQN